MKKSMPETRRPLMHGDEIYGIIPQRPPIVMVDTLYECTDDHAVTGLSILSDNIFYEDGRLSEPGLIEHMAQSAAAFAGYAGYSSGSKPRLGYIGEVRNLVLNWLPTAEDILVTDIEKLGEAAGVTLIKAETSVDGEVIASCRMKIFLSDEELV